MRDEEAVRQFVERMSRQMAEWNFPPMAARVLLTVMTAEEDALSAADLSERLDASSGAISGAVRHLTTIGMIHRVPVPGSRRDLYGISDDTWWEATLTKGNRLQLVVEAIEEGLTAIGGPDTRPGRTLAEMRDFMAFCHEEIPLLLDKWRARRRDPVGP
ncbi:GbsR/MarR family transcriptional regulator [Streptosporangium longisporum]|uniref:MarR family transcriptional regulator n=1 Tax=Streptosporangium longisporum TaxID=46187 RepID=A0ABP6K5S2_9ACTN